jgi:VWFA-related protein
VTRPAIGLVVVLAGYSSLAPGGGQDPSQQPVFRAGTYGVAIDVSVRRRNAPVPALGARDFELVDNGVKQDVEIQANDSVPLDVSLVFDQLYFVQARYTQRLMSDLAEAVASLRPSDRLRIVTFATGVREVLSMQARSSWPESLTTKDGLTAILKRGLPTDASALNPWLRRASMFDALLLALARPSEAGRRHLIIGFTSGVDSGSVLNDAPAFHAVAARNDARLYVALGGSEFQNISIIDGLAGYYTRTGVAGAAVATGGAAYEANPVGAFTRAIEDFRRSYLLRYTLTGVPPGGWHDVIVKTPKFPDYQVRARKGYLGR